MRKLLFLIFTLIIICGYFVIAQTRPSCETPAPFWSPRPTTTQGYVNAICGGGDECYQAWCNYFRPNPGNYQHLDEIPTSYYTQTYTQTSCTGTCKTNTCTSYQSCSSTTGTCTSGNCCTGSCTTPTTETVNTEELKTILINAIKDYFSSQIPKLTVNELKDLIITYFSTSGNTVDLSGTGHYSGKKLLNTYNKAKGITPSQDCTIAGGACKPNACSTYNNCNTVQATCVTGSCCSGSCTSTCTPSCTGKCGGVSDGCGGVCSASCGPLGSKTNPIPLSEPAQRIYNGYVPPGSKQDLYSHGGWVTSPPHSTLWFVIDPYQVLGKPAKAIAISSKWYEMRPSITCIQNKATEEYTPETYPGGGPQIYYDNNPYDLDKYRFLWAFVNPADVALEWSIWATIVPHAGVDTCTSAGDKCMPTYCNLYKNCQPSSATCAESFCCTGTCSGGGGSGLPSPSGPLGSKTNPYKINKKTSRVLNGYIPENTVDTGLAPGMFTLPAGGKYYFEVDPATIGPSVGAFKVGAVFYYGGGTVCKLTQNKSTGVYSSEDCRGYTGLKEIVYDNMPLEINDYKFLYAIDNSEGEDDVNDAIYAVIPFVP